MIRRRKLFVALTFALLVSAPFGVAAEEVALEEDQEANGQADTSEREQIHTGPGVGLDVSTGLIGSFAPVNLGLLFPKIGERVQLGIRATWSMPAVNIAHEDVNGDVITYLPWMITGGFFLHAGSGVIRQLVRVYFGAEVLVGSTFATRDGIIGDNVTLGVYLWAGLEAYVNQRIAFFIEGGASGVFTLEYGEAGSLGGITQHGGTGFFLRIGPRFYLGRRSSFANQ